MTQNQIKLLFAHFNMSNESNLETEFFNFVSSEIDKRFKDGISYYKFFSEDGNEKFSFFISILNNDDMQRIRFVDFVINYLNKNEDKNYHHRQNYTKEHLVYRGWQDTSEGY